MARAAVLFSGGLDSAVLLASELHAGAPVLPIHVRAGLAWEEAEARAIARLLGERPFEGGLEPLATLRLDLKDVYPASHWAITGQTPGYDTPDEDVYLEGRNITLIAKAAVLCARSGTARLVLGPLAGNPFPDAQPAFLDAMARAMSLGLAHALEIVAPFLSLHKADVIRRGVELGVPLDATLSCMSPVDDRHCGRCSKCRERQDAFAAAGILDRTAYAAERPAPGVAPPVP
jgi:7-cyano-7-deazaguanine synthase